MEDGDASTGGSAVEVGVAADGCGSFGGKAGAAGNRP